MLDWLKKVNDFLEGVPMSVTSFFKNAFKAGEKYVQEQVDIICIWIAWKVNIAIERLRQKVIKSLWEQYSKYLVLLQAGQVVQNLVTDPLGTLATFANNFLKPFAPVKEFFTVIVREIPRLAENLANIASSLPPSPPDPSINFNAFKLKINTITLGDIIKGPDGMPSPEEMFPEPAKPFGKASFDASFDKAKAKKKEDKIVYKMPDVSEISGNILGDDSTIV